MDKKKHKGAAILYLLGLVALGITSMASSSSSGSVSGSDIDNFQRSVEKGYRLGSAIRDIVSDLDVDSISCDSTLTPAIHDYAMN